MQVQQSIRDGFIRIDHAFPRATGDAGTVYLCHPFLVHSAQPHRVSRPLFMAQPPLGLLEPYRLHREDGAYSPVEISIREALQDRNN
jgi:hypothetical protein